MSHLRISSAEYLDMVTTSPEKQPAQVLLPHEQAGVDKAYAKRVKEFNKIVEEKVSVSGGDDWHDGAFRATDNAAKIVTEGMALISPYLTAPVVDYPDETEGRVTLGSRTSITQNGYAFPVDIVGFRAIYPRNVIDPETKEEVTATTPESPLGKAILGKVAGDEIGYMNGERSFNVTIDRINQSAVRELFMNASGVDLVIGEE